jgi:hypothetical protein
MLSQVHWNFFKNISLIHQGPFGRTPLGWANGHHIEINFDGHQLPNKVLTRQEVRLICQDKTIPVLFAYVCAMAWGLQGSGPGGSRTVARSWEARGLLQELLLQLRTTNLTRSQAYELFRKNSIPGLGPAYFTKLIYFFLPNIFPGYIMDQWTAKSINLLAGRKIVRMSGSWPNHENSCENYEAFCQLVDFLSEKVGCTGDEFEQRMFSQNGQHRKIRGPWRAHVVTNWETDKPSEKYDHQAMLNWVAQLKTLNCI